MNNSNAEFIRLLLSMQHDHAADSLSLLKETGGPIYIFGAGAAGRLVKDNLEHAGFSIHSFVDNSQEKIGTCLNNIPIVNFQRLLDAPSPKTVVIGTVEYHDEIVSQCVQGGIPRDEICYADFLHYGGKDFVREFFCDNIDSIIDIFDHCADEQSRELFVSNILYQLNRDRRHYMGQISSLQTQYYDPEIIKVGEKEVYFDCGAKDGDTALRFHDILSGKYRKILAFEPDKSNFSILLNQTMQYPEIHCINAGVGEFNEVLSFNGGVGGHSSFRPDGDEKASIIPLDTYFEEVPTLIKMDIEGFELSALKGASRILKEWKPKLAICVYHKPCDLVEIPQYILSQRPDYKIYYRLYRNFGHDMVCYCV